MPFPNYTESEIENMKKALVEAQNHVPVFTSANLAIPKSDLQTIPMSHIQFKDPSDHFHGQVALSQVDKDRDHSLGAYFEVELPTHEYIPLLLQEAWDFVLNFCKINITKQSSFTASLYYQSRVYTLSYGATGSHTISPTEFKVKRLNADEGTHESPLITEKSASSIGYLMTASQGFLSVADECDIRTVIKKLRKDPNIWARTLVAHAVKEGSPLNTSVNILEIPSAKNIAALNIMYQGSQTYPINKIVPSLFYFILNLIFLAANDRNILSFYNGLKKQTFSEAGETDFKKIKEYFRENQIGVAGLISLLDARSVEEFIEVPAPKFKRHHKKGCEAQKNLTFKWFGLYPKKDDSLIKGWSQQEVQHPGTSFISKIFAMTQENNADRVTPYVDRFLKAKNAFLEKRNTDGESDYRDWLELKIAYPIDENDIFHLLFNKKTSLFNQKIFFKKLSLQNKEDIDLEHIVEYAFYRNFLQNFVLQHGNERFAAPTEILISKLDEDFFDYYERKSRHQIKADQSLDAIHSIIQLTKLVHLTKDIPQDEKTLIEWIGHANGLMNILLEKDRPTSRKHQAMNALIAIGIIVLSTLLAALLCYAIASLTMGTALLPAFKALYLWLASGEALASSLKITLGAGAAAGFVIGLITDGIKYHRSERKLDCMFFKPNFKRNVIEVRAAVKDTLIQAKKLL